MKSSQLTVALYAVLTFASGVVVGVASYRLYTTTSQVRAKNAPRSPEDYRQRYIQEMRSRLKLTDRQVTDLDAVLDSTRDRFRQLREKERPEVKAIQDDQVEHIRALLSADQRTEYEKMRAEREKRMRDHKDGPRKR